VLKYARAVAGRYGELRKLVRLFDTLEGVERPAGYTFGWSLPPAPPGAANGGPAYARWPRCCSAWCRSA
ncbi:hypothetical protein ABTE85_23075, partial [Acinetobacter baumannii]